MLWRTSALNFIVLFLAFLAIQNVRALDGNGGEYSTKLSYKSNLTMSLPNITFCMAKPQAMSHFKINPAESDEEWDRIVAKEMVEMKDRATALNSQRRWDYRLLMEAYEYMAMMCTMERETMAARLAVPIAQLAKNPRFASKRKMAEKWQKWMIARKLTFKELQQKVGQEILRRSLQRWRRVDGDDSSTIRTGIRITWISPKEICFSPEYDKDNYKSIEHRGNFFSFLTKHNDTNLINQSVNCMSVDFHGRPSTGSRFLDGGDLSMDGFSEELCMGQLHDVTVDVRIKNQMPENDSDGTRCRNIGPGELTEFECRSRCRLEMIREMCNCTAVSISYLASENELHKFPLCDYAKCHIDPERVYSDTECSNNCFPDCTQIRYNVKLHTGMMVDRDVTSVSLNWGSFEYLEQQVVAETANG